MTPPNDDTPPDSNDEPTTIGFAPTKPAEPAPPPPSQSKLPRITPQTATTPALKPKIQLENQTIVSGPSPLDSLPSGIRSAPSGIMSAPPGVQSTPSGVQARPAEPYTSSPSSASLPKVSSPSSASLRPVSSRPPQRPAGPPPMLAINSGINAVHIGGGDAPSVQHDVDVAAAFGIGSKTAAPSSLDLLYQSKDLVSLPQVLMSLGPNLRGSAAMEMVLQQLMQRTGVRPPPDVVAAALSDPSALAKALEVTPEQLHLGVQATTTAFRQGKVRLPELAPKLLPLKYDFVDWRNVRTPDRTPVLKELSPGLFSHERPTALSEDEVRANRVIAEIFQRLSLNPGLSIAKKFELTFLRKQFLRFDDFLYALRDDGYEITVSFESIAAQLIPRLRAAIPGTLPAKLVDVPVPLMVKTGLTDTFGRSAVVPASVGEMVVRIISGPASKGPPIEAQMRFCSTTEGTGFHPSNVVLEPQWTTRTLFATLTGERALKALKLAALLNEFSAICIRELNLFGDGFGLSGLFSDAVALLQYGATGGAPLFPLLVSDNMLLREVASHIDKSEKKADPYYRLLRAALREVPSDVRANPSMKQRLQESLRWEAGHELFATTATARTVLKSIR
ncbi:MAG: hypothetical protein JNG84_15095 [Archangium sp.]|nr:hypothetical protein [Archangium sp.]